MKAPRVLVCVNENVLFSFLECGEGERAQSTVLRVQPFEAGLSSQNAMLAAVPFWKGMETDLHAVFRLEPACIWRVLFLSPKMAGRVRESSTLLRLRTEPCLRYSYILKVVHESFVQLTREVVASGNRFEVLLKEQQIVSYFVAVFFTRDDHGW